MFLMVSNLSLAIDAKLLFYRFYVEKCSLQIHMQRCYAPKIFTF
jgi:hypothetical protein